jgi:hypothetical protein
MGMARLPWCDNGVWSNRHPRLSRELLSEVGGSRRALSSHTDYFAAALLRQSDYRRCSLYRNGRCIASATELNRISAGEGRASGACRSFAADGRMATVEAIDESVLNALVAADTVPTIKPPGQLLKAINHEALREVMRRYGKLVTA